MTDWLSNIVMPSETDGDRGGPWTLSVTCMPDREHWWALEIDEEACRPGMKVYRSDRDGTIALVTVDSDLPFEEVAEDLGLHLDVFGSPTLWPVMHRRTFDGEQPTGESGWAWVHRDVDEGFPFRS
jgi:hypothetical protein